MRIMRNLALFMLLVSSAALAGTISIPIVNPSFEAPDLSTGNNPGQIFGSSGGTWVSVPVPGWSLYNGLYNPVPNAVVQTSPLPAGATDGNQVLGINQGSVYQILSSTLQDNTTYTLSVDVAQRTDDPTIIYWVYLYAGQPGNWPFLAVDFNTLHPVAGNWLTSTISYTSGPNDPFAGQSLVIMLGADRQQTVFDNVRLTATDVVPEPGSWLLAASGLGVLVRKLRRASR